MVPFSITTSWEPRRPPRHFDEAGVALWSAEMRALFRFVAEFDGPLTLHFGDLAIELDLDDLRHVYDDVDELVSTLETQGGASELIFAAQGTSLRLALSRTGEAVTVSFQPGHTAPAQFAPLAGRTVEVDANRFISAWLDLRDRVRSALSER
ncbi:hypothetical protein ABZ345_37790 [Lentzea sp. NPDC005914]|uniref:hypothetical protein n=1 Tax=Lentzea sp. NPDC005914 TaxID=3154572 RepID=UPI003408BFB0